MSDTYVMVKKTKKADHRAKGRKTDKRQRNYRTCRPEEGCSYTLMSQTKYMRNSKRVPLDVTAAKNRARRARLHDRAVMRRYLVHRRAAEQLYPLV